MFYKEGDIVYLTNIKFRHGPLDTRINDHPVLIIKIDKTAFYYLTISSRIPHKLHNGSYYYIKKSKSNKLKLNSYINLKYIYSRKLQNYIPTGYIDISNYNKIIDALYKYQLNNKEDINFKYIKYRLTKFTK